MHMQLFSNGGQSRAECIIASCMPGHNGQMRAVNHTQAQAHLNWQTVGTKLKAKQTAQAPVTQEQGTDRGPMRHGTQITGDIYMCTVLRRPWEITQPLRKFVMYVN